MVGCGRQGRGAASTSVSALDTLLTAKPPTRPKAVGPPLIMFAFWLTLSPAELEIHHQLRLRRHCSIHNNNHAYAGQIE
jgi:hypothetical protein